MVKSREGIRGAVDLVAGSPGGLGPEEGSILSNTREHISLNDHGESLPRGTSRRLQEIVDERGDLAVFPGSCG